MFARIGTPAQTPFKPDPYQLEAIEAIKRSDCLVTAPTGAGKTWIALNAIEHVYQAGGRCWYASPLKALSNAKFQEFGAALGVDNVGILTGDRKENPEAPVIVGTTEILRNQLYDAMHTGVTLATDFVVLDEAHFLGDPERGVVWEEIMIYLPARIPLLMLSATVGNADQIAGWLTSLRGRSCQVVAETVRPVPLEPLFLHPAGTLLPLKAASKKKKGLGLYKKVRNYLALKQPPQMARPGVLPPFGDIIKVLRKYDLLPAIFFLKSRADCDRALTLCMGNRERSSQRQQQLTQRIHNLLEGRPAIAKHRQRWHLEHLALGAHHSGQLPAWKLVLEKLMTGGLLDAVFATSTVAAGVNFPARTVVFTNTDRFNGQEFLPLTPTEFHQMTGRAGRRGMDKIGFALALPGKFMDLRHYARLVDEDPSDVVSQIQINFSMTLNLLLSHDPEQIIDLLQKSFAAYMIGKTKNRRVRDRGKDLLHRRLDRSFERHLAFLKETGFVDGRGRLTEDGIWASRLRVEHPLIIAEGFRRGLFPDDNPRLMAAIMTAFVNEQEFGPAVPRQFVPKALQDGFESVHKGLTPFARQMISRGFAVPTLYLRPAATMYAWSKGVAWPDVHELSEMAEGNLAMLVLRTADMLRHVRALGNDFPKASETAGAAVDLILREPVAL